MSISIAVLGHTNTGKTSLIRTLLRNARFGEVANAAGTTRHVEKAAIHLDGSALLTFFDTPGLEDSEALFEEVALLSADSSDLRAGVECLLKDVGQHQDFDQECKVLRQAGLSDVLLYVVDVRAEPLEKYRCELKLLSALGKPILPVFNFIHDEQSRIEPWRSLMVAQNLHASLEFDTVAFDMEAEKRLYQKLQSLLEAQYEPFQRLLDARAKQWQQVCEGAAHCAANLLIDAATLSVSDESDERAREKVQEQLRKAESRCLSQQLRLFDFDRDDVELVDLSVSGDEWDSDLFDPQTLKLFGLDARSAVVKGAAAGAGIDLMVGGLTLGTAAGIGALIGAGVSTVRRYGAQIRTRFSAQERLGADELTLRLLYLRQCDLLSRLAHRGHARLAKTRMKEQGDEGLVPAHWPSTVEALRSGCWSKAESNQRYHKAIADLKKDFLLRLASSPD